VWCDSSVRIRMMWLVCTHTCDVTRLYAYVWCDSSVRTTRPIYTCDTTHSYLWHDASIQVSSYICRYRVATISRLLKITSLFCRVYSLLCGSFARETCNFKEPTNRSHLIALFSSVHAEISLQIYIQISFHIHVYKSLYIYIYTVLFVIWTCRDLFSHIYVQSCDTTHPYKWTRLIHSHLWQAHTLFLPPYYLPFSTPPPHSLSITHCCLALHSPGGLVVRSFRNSARPESHDKDASYFSARSGNGYKHNRFVQIWLGHWPDQRSWSGNWACLNTKRHAIINWYQTTITDGKCIPQRGRGRGLYLYYICVFIYICFPSPAPGGYLHIIYICLYIYVIPKKWWLHGRGVMQVTIEGGLKCVTWHMTHTHVTYDWIICSTWLVQICENSFKYVWTNPNMRDAVS